MAAVKAWLSTRMLQVFMRVYLCDEFQIAVDPGKITRFERWYAAAVGDPAKAPPGPEDPRDAYLYLQYLARNKPVVFHGTDVEVEALEPRTVRGTEKYLFATDNVLQALSRSLTKTLKNTRKLRGRKPVRFGAYTFIKNGLAGKAYSFLSLNQTYRNREIPTGIIYICPSDKFRREAGSPAAGLSNLTHGAITSGHNWVATQTVRPLGKVGINPFETPGGVGWHTDADTKLSTIRRYKKRKRQRARLTFGHKTETPAAPY